MRIEEYRAWLEQIDPVERLEDMRWAMHWSRRYYELPRHASAATRDAVAKEMIDNTMLAIRTAKHAGAALVVSAAVSNAAERIKSAKRFGKAMAADRMRAAGFDSADYDITADDIDAMVRAAVRKILQDDEMWEHIDDDAHR